MTKQEVSKILTIIQTEYPNSFAKLDRRQMETKFDFWCAEFATDDYNSVFTALRQYINSGAEFAPNVGQLRSKMQMQKPNNDMSDGEAFGYVSKACRNGLYGYKEEFAKLPPDVQKAVGRPEQLREWAMLEETEFQTIAGSQFLRSYRAVKERKRETDSYPPDLVATINKLQIGMASPDALPEGETNG